MKTLATSLVAAQEISEDLKAGMALENMEGEFFYANDCWSEIHCALRSKKITKKGTSIYPSGLRAAFKDAESEITDKKLPVGCLLKGIENKIATTHLILKFTINYTSGKPFCFCTLAKKIENEGELNFLIKKIKEVFKLENHPKFFNHTEQQFC